MNAESITLRARDGSNSDASAQITRWSTGVRLSRAAGIVMAGLVIGASTIVIPTVHLVSTWLIPLLSMGIALYVVQIRTRIDRVEGVCPKCGAAVAAGPFGAATDDEPLWVRCPACVAPLEVRWTQ